MEVLKVIMYVAVCLAAINLIYFALKCGRKFNEADAPATEPAAPAAKAENAKPTEEVVEIAPVKEEKAAPAKEATEEVAVSEEEEHDEFAFSGERGKRVPFAEKLLSLNENVQGYYDAIVNEFASFRKINRRISVPCTSFRFGRELVAKVAVRGRTMKLHLALDFKDFDENVYFQKDMSDVKAYAEVPFTVKVKSDRGAKNAIKLINALAEKRGIEKKARYEKIDAVALLKETLK